MHWVGYRAVKSLVCVKKKSKKANNFVTEARFYQRVFNIYVFKCQINYLFIYLFYFSPIEMTLNVEL